MTQFLISEIKTKTKMFMQAAQKNSVRFAEPLAFVPIEPKELEDSLCYYYKKKPHIEFAYDTNKVLCFV